MTRLKSDSGKYGYGIARNNNDQCFLAKVPKIREGNFQKTFKSLSAARSWQVATAKKVWGLERFSLIKKGRLCILRRFGTGVRIRKARSTMLLSDGSIAEYWQYGVFWYEHNGTPRSKMFSYKQYGNNADIEAAWFAVKQRAKLTNSELNLPKHWLPSTFDSI
ncbi:hypothetical protein [Vibrio sp. YQ_11]|uniref:hypothetical protein n=1 Tax=unclassified Vibrio TaxID=2614977 RepID=UPI00370B46B8